MICIYPADCTDFSTNGAGTLLPQSCTVTETLNGEYELTLVHPIDEHGKWRRLMEGCILRAPVPAAMTPRVQQKAQTQTGGTDIYRITGGRVNLRSGPGTGYRVLKVYKKGTEVLLQEKTNTSWYEIVCPDGKRGFMSTKYLSFVRSESNVQAAVAEVVESRQLRDQPFRIYRVVPELNQVTVYARHIFYDLLDNMVKSLKPSSSAMGASVVQELAASCESEHPFSFFSDLEATAEEVEYTNVNPVEALLGEDGIVEKYSGELQRDWYDVYVVERVGSDTDIEIREGKNLLGVSYDVDLTNVTTRIMPTGADKDGELLYLPELYVDSLHIGDYPHPRWMHLAVSEAKEVTSGDDKKSKEQCYTELRAAAKAEYDKGCDLPTVTLNVDFINCADTEEYRDYHLLQNIYLGDAVRVIAPRIGVAVSMRLTQYTYDCLKRKYTQLSLGTVAETLEGSMISSRQLPSGSITGGKLVSNSVGSLQLKAASILAGHIDADAITTDKLAAGVVTAEKLAAGAVDAGALSAIAAKISSLTAGDIETDTLAAGLAAFTVITCGSASFDQATVQHLVAEALNLSFGVGDEVFINNLKVAYAQMVSAAIGNLCISASDGNYYTIDVDADGNVSATPTTVTGGEIASGQTNAGRVILETDITAENLSTSNLLATYALINRIDAARIDVDQLFAREAFIAKLRTSEIIAEKSLTIIAGEAAEAKEAYNKAVAAQATAQQALSNTEVIVGTQTAATGAWTGVASFSSLQDGQQIVYWLPYAGSGNASLNLTLADGSTTGAKPCYYSGASRITTHYAAGNAIHLTYRVNANVNGTNYTGWWADANYNSNTYDRIVLNSSIKAKAAITAGRLIVGDSSGFFHLGASTSFDVNKPILYCGTSLAASASGTNNYLSYPNVNLRTTLGDSSWAKTRGETCYLAGTLSGTSFTPLASDYLTCTAATSGVAYISLGLMVSTYQIYLYPEHPIYMIQNGTLMAISQLAYEAATTADETQQTMLRIVRIAEDGLHVGDNQNTNNEVRIDSEAVNVITGGQMESKFTGSYIQFGAYQLRRTADNGLAFKVKEG